MGWLPTWQVVALGVCTTTTGSSGTTVTTGGSGGAGGGGGVGGDGNDTAGQQDAGSDGAGAPVQLLSNYPLKAQFPEGGAYDV